MNAVLVSLQKNLIEEIIPLLKVSGKDYSSNLVVFPGKRPAHFLRQSLSQRSNGSIIPPVIFSMDEFIDYIYGSIQPDRKIDSIDAVSILFDIHKKTPCRLGGDGFLTPDSFFPIGLKIYRDIEDMYIEGVHPHRVKEIDAFAEENIPPETLTKLQSLSFFYEEFYRKVSDMGISTRSLRYRTVAEKIDISQMNNFHNIILAGFFAFTKCEKDLSKKLLKYENALFIFQNGAGIRETLGELGITAEPMGMESPEPETHFYSSPDTHGQVFALGNILKGKDMMDRKTVIVLPAAETLFPLLRQGLSIMEEEEYNISIGYPLVRTPIFGFLNNLMELVTSMENDRIYIPEYLKFVLHPYTKNIYFRGRADVTRIMFHTIEESFSGKSMRRFISLSEICGDYGLLQNIMGKLSENEKDITPENIGGHLKNIHDNTIGKFLSFQNVKDLSLKCTELLVYIFNNSSAKLHHLFYPFSESFIKHLAVISKSLMQDISFKETTSYFSFLRKYFMTCHTPFEGTPVRGLQVLGFLETRNLKFDKVIVLDANEGFMPDTRKEDSLLPLRAKEALGLPTYMDRDKIAAYYFETLLRGSREVHLFFIENDKNERSRFVEKLLWEKQKKNRDTDAKRYVRSIRYEVNLESKTPAEVRKDDKIVGFLRDFTFSPSSLNEYLKCQMQFYYSHVLNLAGQNELSGDIERKDIGNIVHKAISEFFIPRIGRVLEERDIDMRELDNNIEKVFADIYGKDQMGSVYLFKNRAKKHLKDLLEKYYLPLVKEESFIVGCIEKNFQVSLDSFKLKGRMDSVEKRGNKTFIVDYKISSAAENVGINFKKLYLENRASWNKEIKSIQLPFYMLLYSGDYKVRIDDLNGMFLFLGRPVIDKKIEHRLFDNQDEYKYFELLKTIIFRLLNEIVDPAVPFRPTSDNKGNCPFCDFRYICGTQWVVKRKG
ncbi:MAG: PD-(D/E)XK nuclease family protein [Nitrospirae bacterium]|nr:PD-(D/E)XK nuclease family protein [Nitrospirota bacterium]